MMDRFKFRVWSKEDCGYMESNDIFRLTHGGKLVFNNDGLNREPECNPKRFICEQCTGLKDKNGKLIYEGDIVKINGWWDACGPAGYDKNQTIVKWNKEFAGFEPMCMYDCDCGVYHNAEECEIIGNIHQDKELLDE